MKYLAVCAVLYLLSIPSQDIGEPMSLHVKEVTRTQDEGNEKGTWFHIKVVAESKTVVYGLSCDEFISIEKHGYTLSCYHVAAGKDYAVKRFPTAINFWPPGEKAEGTMAMYEILSEKEK
jgi:hypothetical protein